jgi:lysine-N-methylase
MSTVAQSAEARRVVPATSPSEVTAARYVGRFRCVGGGCVEHCCQGWRVTLDRDTYLKYQSIPESDLRERLRDRLSKVRDGERTASNYATLDQDDSGVCPMLDAPSGLCDVQRRKGEDWLSPTCNQYPRLTARIGPQRTTYLTPSCPEATRLMLLERDALDIVDGAGRPRAVSPLPDVAAPGPRGDVVAQLAQAIHDTAREIVRDPRLRADQALAILGVVARKPRAMRASSPPAEHRSGLLRLLHTLRDPNGVSEALRHVEALQVSRAFQCTVLTRIHDGYLKHLKRRPRLESVMADCEAGLRLGEDPEGLPARYDAADRDWFRPFDDRHPHLLKHYVLNDLGRKGFPSTGAGGLEHEYLGLAVRLALIRMYLVGIAAHRREAFGVDDYLRVIQTFGRNFEHNATFMPSILDAMKGAELDTTACAMLLLR